MRSYLKELFTLDCSFKKKNHNLSLSQQSIATRTPLGKSLTFLSRGGKKTSIVAIPVVL